MTAPEPSSSVKRTRWTFDDPCTAMEHTERSTPFLEICSESTKPDMIIVGVYGGGDAALSLSLLTGAVQQGLLATAQDHKDTFEDGSKAGATTPVLRLLDDGGTAKRYTLMGLGEEAACANPPAVGLGLKIGASLAKLADQEKGCQSCLVYLPEPLMSSESFLRDCASSLFYSLYSDNRYRTGKSIVWPAMGMMHLYFAPSHGGAWDRSHFDPFIQEGIQLARGQYLAMDIVNAPHNVLNSLSLANEALHLADTSKNLVCRILSKDDCEARGMGAYLAVARGSETPPQFIHLTYTPRGEIKRKVAVVGKGLLFDTGGYNIKVSGMELMKFDCGGAAAVLGAAKAIDALDIPGVEVHFIVAACENMISAKAYVASDVLVASNGKTIEVVNTDAEGRLTLADALVYADKEIGCDKIIELSTLTGACMISLGKSMAGLWTNSDELAAELNEASKATNEKTWRMPMATEYKDQLESKIADMTNCGTRYGGAITAALFLQNFIEGDKPFSHIDIAGPVWHDKKGATGFGVKLITEWCRIQGQQ